MAITFKDLQDGVLRALDEYDNTATHSRDRVKVEINRAHRRLFYARPWPFSMWYQPESFTTEAGVRTYALSEQVGKLRTLWGRSQGRFVSLVPTREWESLGMDRSSTARSGDPSFIYGPVWPVPEQPATAVASGSARIGWTATTGDTLFLEGITSAGVLATETITGVTATAVASANTYAHLIRVERQTITSGSTGIVATEDTPSGGVYTTLFTFRADEESRPHMTLETIELPSAGLVYDYTFQRKCRTLEEDNDLPDIHPNDLAELLVYTTLLEEATYNPELAPGVATWTRLAGEFQKELEEAWSDQILGAYPRFVRDLGGNSVRYVSPG